MASPSRHDDELVRHAAWVRNLVRGMVRDPGLAEDLAQDALEAGLRARGEPLRNPRAWLAGVVRNLSRHQARSDANRNVREQAARPPSEAPTPAELVSRAETQQAVARAVLKLPDPYRTVLLMRYFEELPPRRIAELRGVPRKTVENQLHRGLKLLRGELSGSLGSQWAAVVLPLAAGPWAAGLPLGTATAIAVNAKTLTFAAAAALLISLVWILWRPAPDEPGEVTASVPANAAGAADELESAPAAKDADSVSRTDVEVTSRPEAGFKAPCEDEDALLVRVKGADDQLPRAGATVYYFETDRDGWKRLRELESQGLNELQRLEEVGTRYQTDEDGRVRVPRSEHSVLLGARADGEFMTASASGREQPTEVLIEVRPDYHVTVEVTGQTGSPLKDVEVVFQSVHRDPGMVDESWAGDRASALTDEQGVARFRHLQLTFSQLLKDRQVRVALDIPGPALVSAPLDLERPPSAPIHLIAPPTGSVVVELVCPDGEPDLSQAWIRIQPGRVTPEGHRVEPKKFDHRMERGSILGTAVDGQVTFPYVAVGTDLDFYLYFARPDTRELLGVLEGPKYAGDVVHHRIETPASPPALVGRLLSAGEPLQEGTLTDGYLRRYDLFEGGYKTTDLRLEAGPEAAFRWQLSAETAESPDRHVFLVWRREQESSHVVSCAGGTIPASLRSGDNPYGDLDLGGKGVILSGVVLDPSSEPVGGAFISFSGKEVSGERTLELGNADNEPALVTNADGAFELRGNDFFLPDAVYVHGPDILFKRFPVRAGDVDLRLEVDRTIGVEVSVEIDESLADLVEIRFYADVTDGPEPAFPYPVRAKVQRGEGAPDLWTELPNTQLEMQVVCPASEEVLAYFENIRAGNANVVRDQRLNPVRLEGLEMRTIQLARADGVEVADAEILKERMWPGIFHPMNTSRLQVVTRDAGPTLSFRAFGTRAVTVQVTEPVTEVELPLGYLVQVEATGLGLEEADAIPGVRVAGFGWNHYVEIVDGAAELRLPDLGEYRVQRTARFPDLWSSAAYVSEESSDLKLMLDTETGAELKVTFPVELIATLRKQAQKLADGL